MPELRHRNAAGRPDRARGAMPGTAAAGPAQPVAQLARGARARSAGRIAVAVDAAGPDSHAGPEPRSPVPAPRRRAGAGATAPLEATAMTRAAPGALPRCREVSHPPTPCGFKVLGNGPAITGEERRGLRLEIRFPRIGGQVDRSTPRLYTGPLSAAWLTGSRQGHAVVNAVVHDDARPCDTCLSGSRT